MPSTPESLVLAENYRRASLTLRSAFMRDMLALWPLLRSDDLSGSSPDWLRLAIVLVQRYRDLSGTLGSQYVTRARLLDLGKGHGPALVPSHMPDEQIIRTLLHTGPGVLSRSRDLLGLDERRARDNALTQTLQASSRLVLDGGRDVVDRTVRADDAALGWMRVTDGDPCSFCAMLASRGAVYKDRASAGAVDARKVYGDDAKGFTSTWHNGCGCQVVPVFSRNALMPDAAKRAADLWERATDGLSTDDAARAFRRAVEGRPRPDDPINR